MNRLRDTWTRLYNARWRCYICRAWNNGPKCKTCGREP